MTTRHKRAVSMWFNHSLCEQQWRYGGGDRVGTKPAALGGLGPRHWMSARLSAVPGPLTAFSRASGPLSGGTSVFRLQKKSNKKKMVIPNYNIYTIGLHILSVCKDHSDIVLLRP